MPGIWPLGAGVGGGNISPTLVNAYDTLANRGSYGGNGTNTGFIYYTSDTGQMYRANGAGWTAITPVGTDPTRLLIANNLSDLANAATARTNLGLGTLAVLNSPLAIANGGSGQTTLLTYGIFGDGSDGVVNFDGVATVLGFSPASGVYTLTRDVYLASGSQVSSTAQVNTNGNAIYCNGTFTIGASAKVQHNGANGSSNTGGGPLSSGTIYTSGGGGGAGVVGAGTGGSAGNVVNNALGGAGGAGGAASGGGTGGGSAGGTVSLAVVNGLPRTYLNAIKPAPGGSSVDWSGGAGGRGGNSVASSTSGGGGSGGGVVGLFVLKLVNSGAIEAKGGVGGNASGAGTGAGGGGGGGGGAVVGVVGPGSTLGTITVTGGAGGTLQGAGATGATGSSGTSYLFQVA